VSDHLMQIMVDAQDQIAARAALVDYLCDDGPVRTMDLILSFELYAYASRRPLLKTIMLDWMAASRRALQRHFTVQQANALDAMIEGITIHNAMNPKMLDRQDIRLIVERLST
jgi:TetR/AcrR family transcriptional regulator, regulator of biofilm formation and stress response